jgi:hypothetical protein
MSPLAKVYVVCSPQTFFEFWCSEAGIAADHPRLKRLDAENCHEALADAIPGARYYALTWPMHGLNHLSLVDALCSHDAVEVPAEEMTDWIESACSPCKPAGWDHVNDTAMVKFMKARLYDERLAAAEASWGTAAYTPGVSMNWRTELEEAPPDSSAVPTGYWVVDERDMGVGVINGTRKAAHIALHDPAKVLGDVNAKGEIVTRFSGACDAREVAAMCLRGSGVLPDEKDLAAWAAANVEASILRPLVQHLDAAYDRHPAYSPIWKPAP